MPRAPGLPAAHDWQSGPFDRRGHEAPGERLAAAFHWNVADRLLDMDRAPDATGPSYKGFELAFDLG